MEHVKIHVSTKTILEIRLSSSDIDEIIKRWALSFLTKAHYSVGVIDVNTDDGLYDGSKLYAVVIATATTETKE